MSKINPLPQLNPIGIQVLVYKTDNTLYLPSGQIRRISCSLEYMGVFGINLQGEQVPIPTRVNTTGEGGTPYQTASTLITLGNVWVNNKQFGDSNFKVVVKVKDMDSGLVSYVDAVSFNANIGNCNFIPAPSFCPLVTGLAVTHAVTTATISWTAPGGATGVEWINNTSGTTPVINGTYEPTNSVSLTGLTTATAYHFWVRTICSGGVLSAWTSISYTTS